MILIFNITKMDNDANEKQNIALKDRRYYSAA